MKKSIYLAVFLFALFFVSCSTPLTMDDNKTTVEFAINTPFEVKLEANPGTGYQWHIVSYDSSVIRKTGEPEFGRESDEIGAPGHIIYQFETIASGETTLLMVYKKPGQENEDAFRNFSVHILSGTMGRITAQ